MGSACEAKLRYACLICLKLTDRQTLEAHNHCCTRSEYCENKFKEITRWERDNFGNSLLEEVSKNL